MNFCKDCKWYSNDLYLPSGPVCKHEHGVRSINQVSGNIEYSYCALMRIEKCKNGKYFEQKEVKVSWFKKLFS